MSLNYHSHILNWLGQLPTDHSPLETPAPKPQKRHYPPSPSMSSEGAKKGQKTGSDIFRSQKIPLPLPRTPGSASLMICVIAMRKILVFSGKARTSATDGESEYSWNVEVHQAVLDLALRDLRDHVEGDRVNFKFCPSARIMIEYRPGSTPESKMIDLCAVIEPEVESLAMIDGLRKVLPMNSINHTACNPLLKKPLCLAIETKPPGEKWNAARLQVGVWLAAQWTLLARLVHDAGGSFEGLDFLPGIIIQGHEWYFVASGREGTKTVL
ncbi:hypothetical protein DER46DRAFT_578568 [Fusarium sp. MPI-SDFR-AT-0072]|nr:hypothetical protein DER46DRAFT_578568 [Fusarium sp. MPI-SDFR-AT-0072]